MPLTRRQILAAGAALLPAARLGLLRADDKPLIPVTGTSSEKFARLDELMTLVITKPKLPGGAVLAVSKDGKSVYERGFAYANSEAKTEMKTDALFRTSSLSKPFTAVAILQLLEKGKLKLTDKIVDVLKLRPAGKKADDRWKKVTIRHLLEHRGGWDHSSKKKIDPTFVADVVVKEVGGKYPPKPQAIIQYVLRQPLDFDPGEKFIYCNFGYLLLGRVIEKLTGGTYEAYVKKNVLAPLDLKSVRQGKTLLADRAPREVHYHSQEKALAVMGPQFGKKVPVAYGGFCLESMDSHSAWLSSAADLLRFTTHFHKPKECKLLKPETVEIMFAPPEGAEKDATYYGKGWMVKPAGKDDRHYWHDGSMEGTSGMILQRADGIAFAVLFNTRQQADNMDPAGALEPHLHVVLGLVFAEKK